MSEQIVPLDNSPNQTFQCTLAVDGKNITLGFYVRYNEQSLCWIMTVIDPATGNIILDQIPLITGNYPSGNLLEQYTYLGIGSASILKMSDIQVENPNDTNLGTDFVLYWGDTP